MSNFNSPVIFFIFPLLSGNLHTSASTLVMLKFSHYFKAKAFDCKHFANVRATDSSALHKLIEYYAHLFSLISSPVSRGSIGFKGIRRKFGLPWTLQVFVTLSTDASLFLTWSFDANALKLSFSDASIVVDWTWRWFLLCALIDRLISELSLLFWLFKWVFKKE